MNLAYGYADINGNNNGQILSITDNVDSTRSMTYEYDAWSRLKTATAGPTAAPTWKLSWDYDRFGNRWGQILALGQGYNTVHSFNTADNRVTTAGFTYDNSGNVTANATGTTFSYNQENFLATASGSISYTYDAQNRRVRKTVSSTVTDYFYVGWVVIAEKQGSTWTDYIFFGNQRIVKQTGSTASTATYVHPDHLGSTRVCTDASGNSVGTCDYEPVGEIQVGASCSLPTNYRFAGMEWDSETGLYHTWFRQYDPSQGRWMSVDPLGGSIGDPQSLDRYPYVLNDPINLVDPLGLCHGPLPPAQGPPPGSDCTWSCSCTSFPDKHGDWSCQWKCGSETGGGGEGSDPNPWFCHLVPSYCAARSDRPGITLIGAEEPHPREERVRELEEKIGSRTRTRAKVAKYNNCVQSAIQRFKREFWKAIATDSIPLHGGIGSGAVLMGVGLGLAGMGIAGTAAPIPIPPFTPGERVALVSGGIAIAAAGYHSIQYASERILQSTQTSLATRMRKCEEFLR